MHLNRPLHLLTAAALTLQLGLSIAPIPASAVVLSEGQCGEQVVWTLSDDGVLTLSGSGATYDYPETQPWLADAALITQVAVGEGVTALGDYLFAELTELEAVTLPDTLTGIGNSTFSRCVSLQSVALPDSLTMIGDYGFYQTGLTTVALPDALASIGTEAFGGCVQLTAFKTEITNPNFLAADGVLYSADMQMLVRYPIGLSQGAYTVPDVVSIGAAALADTNFTSVTIPETVREIGARAFYGCYQLETVQFSYGLRAIGNQSFGLCTSLNDVTLPNSLESLSAYAFRDCYSLTTIQLPFRLSEVYHESFANESLRTVYCYSGAYSAYVAEYYSYDTRLLGDLNEDGAITTDDAVAILQIYANSLLGQPLTNSKTRRIADLNLSGTVDLLDAVAVLRYDARQLIGQSPDWGMILL